jgi:proline iminopeptidase
LTKPEGIRSLILSSPAISIPRWLADANVFRSQLPSDVQATLKKHEDAGTTSSQEYQDAVAEYYKKHLCRIFPFPAPLDSTMKNAGMDVYLTMWGPSEFFGVGNLKDYDRTSRLKEIRVPVLYTAGRYDEATPETTQYYQSLTPGSSLVILENSSHMAMLEETDRYIQVVRDFLRRVEGK